MDEHHFDRFAQSLAQASTSRRDVLKKLIVAGLGAATIHLPAATDAKKRRKRKKKAKPATPNAFGCIDVGDRCTSATQCCSGICEGKKSRQTCRAHDEGGCTAGAQEEYCGGADVACTTSAGAPGRCGTTTGNAAYCSTVTSCYFCKTDVDCQLAAGGVLGPRAACIQCAECSRSGGTACATRDYIVPEASARDTTP
jgi:hypothetical protein